MKPIRLEMTAFGPYRGKEIVDFTKLGSGIYAIIGPTGSGKTTIFDALMFALYEEVSTTAGSADPQSVRAKKMLHCELADQKTDTAVRLDFEEKGKSYTVTRTIHLLSSGPKYDATLEGDIKAVTGSVKVTREIESILGGVDALRFRQIVMLAQGQFRAFLEARDDSRKEILSQLFDSKPYYTFQTRLKSAAAELSRQKAEQEELLRRKLAPDVFLLPDDAEESERSLYSPELPTAMLAEHLLRLIETDTAEAEALQQQEQALAEEVGKKNREIGAAENINKLAKELQDKRAYLTVLDEKTEQVRIAEKQLQETEKALHQVKPQADKVAGLSEKALRYMDELKQLQDRLSEAAQLLKNAKAETDRNPGRKAAAEKLAADIQRMQEHLDDLDQLAVNCRKQTEITQAQACAEQALEAAQKETHELDRRLGDIGAELVQMQNAEQEAAAAEQSCKQAEGLLDELTRPVSGLRDRVHSLLQAEDSLREMLLDAQRRQQAAVDSAEAYNTLHDMYIRGYAGRLGVELEASLQKTGTARCPVCNSEFCAGQEHRFSAAAGKLVTDAELKQAEEQKTAADKASREATNKLTAKQTAIEAAQKTLQADLNRFLPDLAPWEWVPAHTQDRLETAIEEATKDQISKQELRQSAQQAVQKKLQLQREQTEKNRKLNELSSAIAAETGKRESATAMLQTLTEEIVRNRQAIEAAGLSAYADRAAAEQAQRELALQKQLLEKAMVNAENVLNEANQTCTGLNARQTELQRQAETNAAELTNEKSLLQAVMMREGFADAAAYQTAVERCRTADSQEWIDRQRKRINDYYNDRQNTALRIEELEHQAPVFMDTEAIKRELETLITRQNSLKEQSAQQQKRADSHKDAMKTLRAVSDRLGVIKGAYDRVKQLSDVANGDSGSGGKHAFDGYVLGSTFREMLAHASRYLDEMTCGKYTLVHDRDNSGVRKNASADFRIIVQDNISGTRREIGSLSGGESFQAAMALALGLSDTVQSHHSTVSIDTMFIDEGFGSLDTDSLSRMLKVLGRLANGKRQIGIISHVNDIRQTITNYISVSGTKDTGGSHLKVEASV